MYNSQEMVNNIQVLSALQYIVQYMYWSTMYSREMLSAVTCVEKCCLFRFIVEINVCLKNSHLMHRLGGDFKNYCSK